MIPNSKLFASDICRVPTVIRGVKMLRSIALATSILVAASGTTSVADAKDAVLYKIGKLPDFKGIVVKQGKMFAPFEMIDWGLDSSGTINKMVPLTADGKQHCLTTEWSDDDIRTYVKSCVSLTSTGEDRYAIKVVVRYDLSAWFAEYPEDLALMKKENRVKERRYEIDFAISGATCTAYMVKRTYVPLDGTKQKPSTTGDLGCTVKR